jgi:hypothetical protein
LTTAFDSACKVATTESPPAVATKAPKTPKTDRLNCDKGLQVDSAQLPETVRLTLSGCETFRTNHPPR